MPIKCWSETLRGRNRSGDLDVGGKIILKWIFMIYGTRLWNGFKWHRTDPVVGSRKQGNEISCCIKVSNFELAEQLRASEE